MDLNELTKVMLMLGGFTVGGLTLSACGGGGGGSSGSDGGSSSGEDNSYCTDDSCTEDDTTHETSVPSKYADAFLFDVLSGEERILLGTSDEFEAVDDNNLHYGSVINVTMKIKELRSTNSIATTDDGEREVKAFFYYPRERYILNPDLTMSELVENIKIQNFSGNWITKKLYIGTDPLLAKAWHVQNKGYDLATNSTDIKAGVDYNVVPVWKSGFNGHGVGVLVVDADMEIKHEDLVGNVDVSTTYNLKNKTHDTTPNLDSYTPGVGHGTSVAGIIASSGGNFLGSRGIAFGASLSGLNYVAVNYSFADVFSKYVLKNNNVRVVNNSWVKLEYGQSISSAEWMLLDEIAAQNKVMVVSAGNFYSKTLSGADASCNTLGINSNCLFLQGSTISIHPESIVVAAAAADGNIASYSTAGGHIWVTGLGGGLNLETKNAIGPQITTTDLSGCEAGYAYKGKLGNAFENGSVAENKNCNYNISFNGTSAAAPGISGIVALMLEANPKLDPDQVRYILMRAARTDEDSVLAPGNVIKTVVPWYGKELVLDDGWVTNDAGIRSSIRYGFGLPDAFKAVQLARNCDVDAYTNEGVECANRTAQNCGQVLFTGSGTLCREFKVGSGYKYVCDFDYEDRYLGYGSSNMYHVTDSVYLEIGDEFVYDNDREDISADCKVANFVRNDYKAKHKSLLQIELISPKGTKSILKPTYQNIDSLTDMEYETDMPILTLRTNRFYGEGIEAGYQAVVYSKCPLKIPARGDDGYDFMRVKVYGYKQ